MAGWLCLLVIGLPWLGAVVVWRVGDEHPRAQHALAVGFSLLGGAASLALLAFRTADAAIAMPVGGVFGTFTLVPDGLGVFLAAVAAVIGSLAVIFSVDYMYGEAQLGRYYALVLLFIGSMCGLVLSGSLLFMFVFWEMTAFCSYALISFHNDDPKAVAGGIKALIVTQLGGIGLLAGALILYAATGSYQIHDVLAAAGSLPAGMLALAAYGFLFAAAAKSAQVPLHTWLPDAMEAPTPISALIHAATMVNAGVYLLARFYPAFAPVPGWALSVTIVGLLSALLAASMALVADDLKRVLAYSTISQLGYMVYAIGTGAVFASQFHLLSHAVFKALLFLGAGAVIHTAGTRDMREMGGLGRQMPFTRAVFIAGAAALTGIPLTNGFASKEMVLEGGLAHGPLWAYVLMLLGVGLTALYASRMVWFVFYGRARRGLRVHDAPPAMRVSLGALALGTLTTWLLAGPFAAMLGVPSLTTPDLLGDIVAAPATWIALCVVALGVGLWLIRGRLAPLADRLSPLARFAGAGLGFEWVNQQIITGVRDLASAARVTQTGQINWNLSGIVGGLIVVLAVVLLGVQP
jgi:NADH-quinone oxidoreductase subunit L